MEYIHNTEQFQFHNTVVALGKFDGMHKGHQLIFDELIQYKQLEYQAAVFSFDRAAEEVKFNSVTTGASNDIEPDNLVNIRFCACSCLINCRFANQILKTPAANKTAIQMIAEFTYCAFQIGLLSKLFVSS